MTNRPYAIERTHTNAPAFTILELIVVIATLTLLAIIAIPTYQDYSIRSRVAEGLHVAAVAKTAVTETLQSNGRLPTSNAQAGLPTTLQGHHVASVTVSSGGAITVAFDNGTLGINAPGQSTILFTPTVANNTIRWDCVGGNMIERYRPSSCK